MASYKWHIGYIGWLNLYIFEPISPPNLGKVQMLHPKGIIANAINHSLGEDTWWVTTGTYGTWVDGLSFPSSHSNQHSSPPPEAMHSASVNGSLGLTVVVGFVCSFGLKGGRLEGLYPDEIRKDLSLGELEGNLGVNSEKQPIKSQCSRHSCWEIYRAEVRMISLSMITACDVFLPFLTY